MLILFWFVWLFALGTAGKAAPPTSQVTYLSVSTALQLRDAIINKRSNQIRMNPGLYVFESPILVASGTVTVSASVPGTVVLSGNSSTRIFELRLKASLNLVNLTFEDGRGEAPSSPTFAPAPKGGGCIAAYTESNGFIDSSQLKLEGTVFRRCSSLTGFGGAIMLHMPDRSIFSCTQCEFYDNYAPQEYGGAIHFSVNNGVGVQFRVDSSRFVNNSASEGGAISIRAPAVEMRIHNSNFSSNHAFTYGGALSMEQDVSVSLSSFERNFAENNIGAAIHMSNQGCKLSIDEDTSLAFIQNGGKDGRDSPEVIDNEVAGQVRIVAFTPAPTSTSFPPFSLPPTLPPGISPPTTTGDAPTPPSKSAGASNNQDIVSMATGVTIGMFVMFVVGFALVSKKRQQAAREANLRAAEAEHNAFAIRRNNRPKVVNFTELVPGDIVVDEPCMVCDGGPLADDAAIAKSLGTISATKFRINNVGALSSIYGRVECGHIFHAACLIRWVEVNGNMTCPICRFVIAMDERRRQSSVSSSGSSKYGDGAMQASTSGAAAASAGGASSSAALLPSQQQQQQRQHGHSLPLSSLFSSSSSSSSPKRRVSNPASSTTTTELVVAAYPASSSSSSYDKRFNQEARRSANIEDIQAENAVLVRELISLRQQQANAGNKKPSSSGDGIDA